MIIENNDMQVAGSDLFADSESFLHELTDSEEVQIVGGGVVEGAVREIDESALSLLLCNELADLPVRV